MSRRFAVVDTETNWNDEVMSIGVLIARSKNFERTDSRYYILPREEKVTGKYSDSMRITNPMVLMICLHTMLPLTKGIYLNFLTSVGGI